MGEFRILLIEGIFYINDGRLTAKKDGDSNIIDVVEALTPFVGTEVQFAVHFLPPMPPDPKRWGGGCCLWEPSGKCPAGHHEQPGLLLNVSGRGVLRQGPDTAWWLDVFDGSRMELPLLLLDGHAARVASVSVFDAEKMKESLLNAVNSDQIEALGTRAADLKELLTRLQAIVKEDKT